MEIRVVQEKITIRCEYQNWSEFSVRMEMPAVGEKYLFISKYRYWGTECPTVGENDQ